MQKQKAKKDAKQKRGDNPFHKSGENTEGRIIWLACLYAGLKMITNSILLCTILKGF